MRKQPGLPWWAWVPFLPVLLTLLLIWRVRRNRHLAQRVALYTNPIVLPPDPPVRVEPQEDDLVIIKGIGAKSAAVLKAAGVCSFAQLANTTPERLKEILLAAGLRLPDPTTWPAQAAAQSAG